MGINTLTFEDLQRFSKLVIRVALN